MEETYRKSKGNAGQKGVQFQLDLVTVCLLNALRNHENWKISSENPMAGKYDDIVIELDLETAVLVQAKHKENRKITREQLLSDNSKTADFSLAKYFLSYEEIKNKFQARTVIICTNTAINMKGLEDILTRQQAQPDSLLHYEDECFFYNVNENILPDLKRSAEIYLRNNSRDKDVDTTMITEENLKDFLENLQIFSCYPCGNHLHEIIEQSLSRLSFSNLCRTISCQEILRKVEDWFLQPKGEYLTEARAKAMLCEIRSDKYCESLKDFNVSFGSNDLDISESQRIVHVKIEEGYLLQILKVYCALQIHKSRTLYVNPDDAVEVQKLAVEAFSLQRYKFLIMVWDAIKDETAKREIINTLRRILDKGKYKYKQVILVGDTAAELKQKFGLEDISQIDGSLTLQDLSEESRARLLKTQNVLFQGHRVDLDELLSTQVADDNTKSMVDSAMLERVVRGREIKVGVRPLDVDEDTAPYYVSRRFEAKIDESGDARNILSEENLCGLKEKMIVISDSAGMGKSTVITKMAVTIKKTNPSLWIIKINLSDYTRILRDFVKSNRHEINAAELLNSQEATRMTNKFENLVFSMNKKVVLMLDGVDEISPDYTVLVLSLLNNCQKAHSFAKVFVTTRPHVDLTQKEVGLFQMLPFSELEQIDFLTNYWIHKLSLSHDDEDKCKQYAEILIRKITTWTKSNEYQQHSFADIPLQARMLAEIFQENIKGKESVDWEGCKEYLKRDGAEVKLPERFNMAKLYDTFIDKKRDIFIEKASPDGSAAATPALLNQFESCLAYHRSLAVNTILPEYKQLFKTQIPEDNGTEEYILKIGIVQRLGDRVHFIHRTFAEYFLADSIVQGLKNPDAFFQQLVISVIFGNDKFNIVQVFLDVLLHTVSLPTNIFKEYRSMKYEKSNVNLIFKLAHDGHVAILRLILESVDFKVIEGRSVNVNDWRLKLSFWKRNTLNDLAVLVRQAGVNIKREDGETPLHLAVKGGHLDMVDFLVKQGADVNMRNSMHHTALHLATHWNSYDKVLVRHGYDVTEEDHDKFTVYHYTDKLETLNWDIIKYLIEHGADLNAEDDDGLTALHLAAKYNKIEVVESLLENGADINMINSQNDTALHIATDHRNWDIVKFLVERDADVSAENDMMIDITALHVAAYDENWNVVKFLLEHGANINTRGDGGLTALHMAAKLNETDTVEYLLVHGVQVNIKNRKNNTALHIATYNENWDMVKCLVENGADVNAADDTGIGALHVATYNENWNIVKFLIDHGADVNTEGDGCLTALHVAAKYNEVDKVECLLEEGVDVDIKNKRQNTALHIAADNENWNIVKCLLEHGADVNAEDEKCYTVLHTAAVMNKIEIIEYLLTRGVDVNLKNSKNVTALHMAAYHGNWNVVKFLLDKDADISSEDDYGLTALHVAAKYNQVEIVEYLLKHGADINMKNCHNDTALHLASYNGNCNVVKFLVECGVDVSVEDDDGLTAFHVAAKYNQVKIVEYFLEHGMDIKTKNTALQLASYNENWNIVKYLVEQGADVNEGVITALHVATYNENWNIVKYLIDHGANVNTGGDDGLTELHLAVKFNEMDKVGKLLEQGVDVNICNRRHNTPLHIATNNENWNIVKYLVENGADVNSENNEGLTALHMAVAFNQIYIVDFLVQHGTDMNMKANKNRTALHIATYHRNWDIVKFLIEHGADVNAEDDDDLTTLHAAAKYDQLEIVNCLLQHGADIDMKNSQNDTALHLSSYNSNWNIVKLLVARGADVNAVDNEGLTALHITVTFDKIDIVQYLLAHGSHVNMKTSKNGTALHMAIHHRNWEIVKMLVEHGADVRAEDDEGLTPVHLAAKYNQVEMVKYLLGYSAGII